MRALVVVVVALTGCSDPVPAPGAWDLSVLDAPKPGDMIEDTPCAMRLTDGGICSGSDPIGCDIQVQCPMTAASARICNAGATTTSGSVSGAFYNADPSKGPAVPICVATTSAALAPGACEVVMCNGNFPPGQLWFRTNDDGTTFPAAGECGGADDVTNTFWDCTLP